jgi:hypothetical protein
MLNDDYVVQLRDLPTAIQTRGNNMQADLNHVESNEDQFSALNPK